MSTIDSSAETMERGKLQEFWKGYSSRPDITAIMLNEKAHRLQEGDCNDIIKSLPDLDEFDVVDIGAGIGRYTGEFAKTAKSVLAVDFIDSFIAKNRENYEHLGNVRFEVNDAMHLSLPPTSVDFVFTNWLLMYLTDAEVVTFLTDVCRWLRPHGYLHLRESCSQPSTPKAKGDTFHTSINPTFYRQKSQYLRLIDQIVVDDISGRYQLHTHWATSVPTYIQLENNWRQCHMIIRKVPCSIDVPTLDQQLNILGQLSIKEQEDYQSQLAKTMKQIDNSAVCVNEIVSKALLTQCAKHNADDTALLIQDGSEATNYMIDSIKLAKTTSMRVWSAFSSIHAYRAEVTQLNVFKEQLCRASWHDNLAHFAKHAEAIYEFDSPIKVVYIDAQPDAADGIVASLKKLPFAKGAAILMVLRAKQNHLNCKMIGKLGNISIDKLNDGFTYLIRCQI